MMELETLLIDERDALVARVTPMLRGDAHMAEDLAQEALLRAWQSMPADLDRQRQRAWLNRTTSNLAIDELRRRHRRPTTALDDEAIDRAVGPAASQDAARDALWQLSAHERLLVLLRFDAGFSHAEIARLLDITEEASRQRVARARAAFLRLYRRARSDTTPLVLLAVHDDPPEPYVRWLENAGAQVRYLHGTPSERELSLADGLVLTGSTIDLHSQLYGEQPRLTRGNPDLNADRCDLLSLQLALKLDIPIVGVCRGHQLLNIASGGDLHQDVVEDGVSPVAHDTGPHGVRTVPDGSMRRLLGTRADVPSEHHQAVRRLGRNLRVTGCSSDGVIESIERRDRRFAIGVQWHPELDPGGRGDLIAEAMVSATRQQTA